jgi:hypothetical protein
MKVHNDLKELLIDFGFKASKYTNNHRDRRNPEQFVDDYLSINSLALGKPEPLAKNKQCDDNFNCDWYNDPDFPDTKCKTQCSTCFAANDF